MPDALLFDSAAGLVAVMEDPSGRSLLLGLVGTPGPRGTPGSGTTDPDALHVTMRLAEFDDDTKRQQARANLGVDVIDLGTFN